jgi:hypothetical protein
MNHILDLEKQFNELYPVFEKIRESNSILFLGAGASVGERRYLSKEIIEYYESYLGKNLHENNITKFVDILSADPDFSRTHFDSFVADIIKKLKFSAAHKIVAGIPWREIITTNYDLLIEQAFDEISGTHNKIYDLKTVRNVREYHYKEANSEIKYIKLHGCLTDKSLYPFAFSTEDFEKLKPFYRTVLNDLKNVSSEIQFLSAGYSYSDSFGKELLEEFDRYNFRDRRWMFNIDPYPNENVLPFYLKNRIVIIKCSFQEFFTYYQKWESEQQNVLVRKKGLSITDSKDQYITFPPKLLLNLENCVKQLNVHTRDAFVKEAEFYRGEEPTFNLITRGVDVIKRQQLQVCRDAIDEKLRSNNSTLLPIFFITGDFGIGKSTLALRLIYELEKEADRDLVAFEIIDFNKIKSEWIVDVVNLCKSKQLVFYCDEIEVESFFKSLLDLQRDLSIEQFQDCSVFFIVPIRENILERFKMNRSIPQGVSVQLHGKFETDEIEELLEKLKSVGLVSFRDANEKSNLVRKVKREYDSDTFVALLGIITSGKHESDLISSYTQLSKDMQKAFLYTALLHKYKLVMPVGWLKQNISMNWDEFLQKVVKAEGKGILLQELRSSHGTQPDLYFKTKHPIIAEKLVEKIIPNKSKQWAFYERMLKTIEPGTSSSYLVNDLLKAFRLSGEYNDTQIEKLFDAAYTKLSDDPYFLLNYAINLQLRRTKKTLTKAQDILIYAESLLEYRNHRFIHRRGVVNFELAKLYFEDEGERSLVRHYLDEARDLFETKRLLDPFSSYSYVDYIKMLVWDLTHKEVEQEDLVAGMINIEELFDLANKAVTDGIDRIFSLQSLYAEFLKRVTDNRDYRQYLEELHSNVRLRPYACILLYNHYAYHEMMDEAEKYVHEMEYYMENFEVIKFLFKYYGRMLYEPNVRIKFLRLSRQNPYLEKENALRYNFFNFIAESYNHNFYDGKGYLGNIKSSIKNLSPEFHFEWLDSNGNEALFDAIIVKNSGDRWKGVKVPSLQQTFRLQRGNYDRFVQGLKVQVRLHFYLFGIIAELVQTEGSDYAD